jgi:cytidylate kinase
VIQTICIEREYGSGAAVIAKKLSAKLGWQLWDEKLSAEIAKRLKCDVRSVQQREERPDSTFYQLIKIFMRGSYEESFSGAGAELLDSEHLFRLFGSVVEEVTKRGPCIIVGRASPWYLRDRTDTMRLFIFASPAEKLRRLLAAGIDEQEAERKLEEVDRDRAAFVKKYHGKTWPLRELYHLMINSAIGDEAVIEMALREMEILNARS